MAIAAFIVSLLALLIAALNFYQSHFHTSNKLFAYVNIVIEFFDKGEVPITLLNAGNSDVVLLGWTLNMRLASGGGSMSRSNDVIGLNKGSKALLNPGNAASATVKLDKNYDPHILSNCGLLIEGGRYQINYFLEVCWCDSSGKEYRAEIDLFDVKIDESNKITGISPYKDREKNLYQLKK